MRQTFTMSDEDLKDMLKIVTDARALANIQWQELGKKMGFKPMTAQPVEGESSNVFTAEVAE